MKVSEHEFQILQAKNTPTIPAIRFSYSETLRIKPIPRGVSLKSL